MMGIERKGAPERTPAPLPGRGPGLGTYFMAGGNGMERPDQMPILRVEPVKTSGRPPIRTRGAHEHHTVVGDRGCAQPVALILVSQPDVPCETSGFCVEREHVPVRSGSEHLAPIERDASTQRQRHGLVLRVSMLPAF